MREAKRANHNHSHRRRGLHALSRRRARPRRTGPFPSPLSGRQSCRKAGAAGTTDMPIIVAVTLFPIDQLSSGVVSLIPSMYRSPTSRPLCVTTTAAVIPSAGSNAASIACFTLTSSRSAGSGALGRTSPIGHGVRFASGSVAFTFMGLKNTSSRPIGSATHPCDPKTRATRVTPFGRVTRTSFFVRSMTGVLPWPFPRGAREVPNALGGDFWLEPGDEHCRAHDLGVASRVMLERVPGGRNVGCIELERFRSCRKCVLGRGWVVLRG